MKKKIAGTSNPKSAKKNEQQNLCQQNFKSFVQVILKIKIKKTEQV